MKTISKLKLNQLSKAELERRDLNQIKGGECCCSCACAGPSSTSDNARSNQGYGVAGDKEYGSGSGLCWCEEDLRWHEFNM